jgi:hypothetical protein
LADVIEAAWKKGARMDGWNEYFKFDAWMDAFRETGLDPDFYACRERDENETLPWSHLSVGVTEFLFQTGTKARAQRRRNPRLPIKLFRLRREPPARGRRCDA